MKDMNRRKFLGRLGPVAALGFLVPWALVVRETQAGGTKTKTKTKAKTKTKTKGKAGG